MRLFTIFIVVSSLSSNSFAYFAKNRIDTDVEESCPSDKNGLISHPTYCDQYVNCWEGKGVVGYCEHGLFFNEQTSSCDYSSNVDCRGKGDSRPQNDMDLRCPEANGHFLNPSYCGQFVICQAGVPTIFDCPSGLSYDSTLGVCVYPEEPSCLQEPPHDPPQQPFPDLNPDVIVPAKPAGPDASNLFPSWPIGKQRTGEFVRVYPIPTGRTSLYLYFS